MSRRDTKVASKAKAKGNDNDWSEPIIELRSDDILVGRGFQYESHIGNAIFHEAIEAALSEYIAAPSRKGKTEVVKRIFQSLSETSRFLRHEPSNGCYYRTTDKDAKQKISHALRYRSRTEIDFSCDSTETDEFPPSVEADESHVGRLSPKQSVVSIPVSSSREQQVHVDVHNRNEKRQKVEDDSLSIFSSGQLESVLGQPHEYHSSKAAPAAATRTSAHPQQVPYSSKIRTDSSHENGELGLGILEEDDGMSSLDDDSVEAKTRQWQYG